MDVLSALVRVVEHTGVLVGHNTMGHRHHISLYADDVVILTCSVEAVV
jgi:hypothetical protein